MSNAGSSFSDSEPSFSGLSEGRLSCQADNLPSENPYITSDITKIVQDVDQKRKLLLEIGHELHAPLNAIIGFSEVLQGAAGQTLQAEKRDEYISLIHKAAMLLENTFTEKLALSETERKPTTLILQQVNISDTLRDVFLTLQQTANDIGVQLEFQFSENLSYINADKQKLQQLVAVLIKQAIEASQPNDIILVKIGKFAGKITITIHGKRLTPDTSNSKNQMQFLSPITQKIVEAHSGSIEFATIAMDIQQIIVKLPIGLKQSAQKPFNPANDIINLNESGQENLSHSMSIEDNIFARKTG